MISFVVVQSWVELAFHGLDAGKLGSSFDRAPGAVVLDQRALWVFLRAYLAVKHAGAVSLDAALRGVVGRSRVPV